MNNAGDDIQNRLRVALIAGTLGQGGAEKQLTYIARALKQLGVDVRLYCLTRNEYYEDHLIRFGIRPIWFGAKGAPPFRIISLAAHLAKFKPHIVQSAHFFTNLYSAICSKRVRAISIGALRSDATFEVNAAGRWGKWLLSAPSVIVANSEAARCNAIKLNRTEHNVFVLANAIDLDAFDANLAQSAVHASDNGITTAIAIGSHNANKRFDLFLKALALARSIEPSLRGMLVGDGVESDNLRRLAGELGLLPDALSFTGRVSNIPALLGRADLLVSCSDHEGFPNVVLEAMAARLPVVATPAGDAPIIVEHERTGFITPFGDVERLADRMVELAHSANLRIEMGACGRAKAENSYSFAGLPDRLLDLYGEIAVRGNREELLSLLELHKSRCDTLGDAAK